MRGYDRCYASQWSAINAYASVLFLAPFFSYAVCQTIPLQLTRASGSNIIHESLRGLRTAMYSEPPLMKEHDSADSPDTESLLSVEQLQERVLHLLPSTTSKRNKRLRTYLHIAAIVFYCVISVSLYIWSARINGRICAYNQSAIYCKKTESCPEMTWSC